MTTPLSESEKAKLAKDNEKASAEALRLASEAQQRDVLAGQRPVATDVAESLKIRLANEEFTKRNEADIQN